MDRAKETAQMNTARMRVAKSPKILIMVNKIRPNFPLINQYQEENNKNQKVSIPLKFKCHHHTARGGLMMKY